MFKSISLVMFVVFSIEAQGTCGAVLNESYCAATYGCLWTNANPEQETGDYCANFYDLDDPYDDSYEVWTNQADCVARCPSGDTFCACYTLTYGGVTKYVQYPIEYATPDACNYAAATEWTPAFSCTDAVFNGISCSDASGVGCYEDSSILYYGDMTNAGICSKPTTSQGCTALPFCKWNVSAANNKCLPDKDCYYYYINGNAGGCHSDSPYYCKTDNTTGSATLGWCTADSITSERRACNALVAGKSTEDERSAACTGDCEYVAGGTTTADYAPVPAGTTFYGWCVPGESPVNYGDMTNAGICSTPETFQGCTALPFCSWDSSAANNKCLPDLNCYYYTINGNVGGCHSESPYNCKTDSTTGSATLGWCTADSITSERRACNALVAGKTTEDERSAACTGDCEYVAGGTTTANYAPVPAGTAYYGWCVPAGSGTSAVHVSSFVLAIVFTVMLAFL